MSASWLMHSPLAYLAISAYFLLFAHLAYRVLPLYAGLQAAQKSHYRSIDGLRGFLALGVFFHHAVIAYYEQKTGVWAIPPTRFYTLTGHIGVSLFFMITGFLFWEKAILQNGKFQVRKFYVSRFKRLAPAYFLSVAMVLLVIASPLYPHSVTGLGLSEIPRVLMFKGIKASGTINMSYWTLAWEWKFYLMLPLLALFAKGWRAFAPAAVLTAYALLDHDAMIVFNFVCGGFAAVLVRRFDWREKLRAPLYSGVALAALANVFLFFDSGYGIVQSLCMLIFFVCIVYGNSLLGLLHSRAAFLLGSISYSIYLLHCIIIYIVIHGINIGLPVSGLSEAQYWAIVPLMGLLILMTAHISYRYFEYPFMRQDLPQPTE